MMNCEFGRSFILIEADMGIGQRLRGTSGSCNSSSVVLWLSPLFVSFDTSALFDASNYCEKI